MAMNAPVAFSDTLSDGLMEAVRDAVRLPIGTRIVAAMSGGVDSTVTAALLARAGYDVVGVTLQLYDHGAAAKRKGACCAGRGRCDLWGCACRCWCRWRWCCGCPA